MQNTIYHGQPGLDHVSHRFSWGLEELDAQRAGRPSSCPTNSDKSLKGNINITQHIIYRVSQKSHHLASIFIF